MNSIAPTDPDRPFTLSPRMRLLWRAVCVTLPIVWLVSLLQNYPGRDFYPLYWGAQRILAGQSPYGVQATADLATSWATRYRFGGVAYPLPFILLIAPFTLLPFTLAAYLWTASGIGLASLCVRLRNDWRSIVVLPFLFLPLYRAADLSQATLIWFGITVLLLLGMHIKQPWLVAICCALLVLKPQNGLLFALYGLVWGWRNDRRVWLGAGLTAIVLGGLAWSLQSGWWGDWIAQMQVYSEVVQPISLLPWSLVVIAATWRLPWWARIAAMQACLFPVVEAYSLVPLLLVWVAIGGRLALAGTALSWLWLLFTVADYKMAIGLWCFILLPVTLAAFWRSWRTPSDSWQHHLLLWSMDTTSQQKARA